MHCRPPCATHRTTRHRGEEKGDAQYLAIFTDQAVAVAGVDFHLSEEALIGFDHHRDRADDTRIQGAGSASSETHIQRHSAPTLQNEALAHKIFLWSAGF